MKIREYTPGDGVAVIALWNKCLQPDLLDEHNFYNRIICDVNFDSQLFMIAEESMEIVGFAYGTKRKIVDEMAGLQPEQGWIVAMGVHPTHRRKGIGKALVDALEATFKRSGTKNISLGLIQTITSSPV